MAEPDIVKQKDDVDDAIDKIFAVFGKIIKPLLFFGVAAVIFIVWIYPNLHAWLPYIGYGLYILFQLFFAIIFMIVQFVALFWFLGRPRMYWIMPGETGVGFKDYKGNDQVLEVARRVVTLLRGVKEFKQMGGEVTRGVLLIGPPGTGKSYLAQCISTEAGVPFGYLSAPSIQGMFWGMDVLRIWGLYNKARKLARKYGACILFIDEIDAIGKSRSGMSGMGVGAMGGLFGGGGGALNELLNQMDPLPRDDTWKAKLLRKLGLRKGKAPIPAVLTMGATNIAEVLDPALLRPGRFDRKMVVDLPDFDGRKDIIQYYLDKVRHVDMPLDRMANDTIDYTPVAIKYVINEAVVQAHFDGRDAITYRDFNQAREIHESGLPQPMRNLSYEQRRRLAYHESGHAVAQLKLRPTERVVRVTIVRHGQALGFMKPKPVEETPVRTRDEVLADIKVSLASRAAEEVFLGQGTWGVGGDFAFATMRASQAIGMWGFMGTIYSTQQPDQRMVERLLDDLYRDTKALIVEHKDIVEAIAEELLLKSELDESDVMSIVQRVEAQRRQVRGPASAPERPQEERRREGDLVAAGSAAWAYYVPAAIPSPASADTRPLGAPTTQMVEDLLLKNELSEADLMQVVQRVRAQRGEARPATPDRPPTDAGAAADG